MPDDYSAPRFSGNSLSCHELLEAVLKIRKSFEKQADHGKLYHGHGVLGDDFIIAIETTGARQPREGSFNNPSFGQDDKLSGITSFDDFHRCGKHVRCPADQFASVAAIGKRLLNIRYPAKQPDQYGASADTIQNRG